MTDLQPEYPDFSTRSLAHLGLNCIGPCRVVDNMISRLCPASATLSLKTTALRRSEGGLHMRTRCISCQTEFDLSNALEKYDLKACSHHQICENACCTKPGFGGSRLCKDHLSAWRDPNPLETDFPQLQNLREHVSPFLQLKWSDEPAMGKVLALMDSIRAGKSPASALRFVDLEYNIFTGRVFEIGMCDTDGTKTMDCRTLYGSEALRAISQTSSTADLNMDRMIMSSVQAHYCTQGSRTAKQVADELKRQGISQETYFIAWHFHTDDLSRLREWLESEGEYGVLPPNSQCIPLIPYFQRNLQGAKLPNNKRFPLTLPILFPIMMGTDHVLAGRNHHALVDAQQLQCMMAIFRVLCLSPQNRPDGWLEQFSQDPSSHRPGLRQAFLESFWEGS